MKTKNKFILSTMIITLIGLSSFAHAEGLVGIRTGLSSSAPVWTLFTELPVGSFLTLEGSVAPNSSVASSYSLGARVGRSFGGYVNVTSVSFFDTVDAYADAGVFIKAKLSEKATFLGKAGVDVEEYNSKYVGQGQLRIDVTSGLFVQAGVFYSSVEGVSSTSSSAGIGLKF